MNCQADHLQFRLELWFTRTSSYILQSFHCHHSAITKLPPINVAKTSSTKYVLGAEIIRCMLQLSESEILEISQADNSLFLIICNNAKIISTNTNPLPYNPTTVLPCYLPLINRMPRCCRLCLYQKSPTSKAMRNAQLRLTPSAIASFLDLCFPEDRNVIQV